MSNAALTHVWKQSKMKGAALILMLAVADMANDDGECWPGKANLSTKCRVSKRHLQRIIQECERAGELLVVENRNEETQRWGSNHYIVTGVGKLRADARKPKREPKKRIFPTQNVRSDASVPTDTNVSTPDDTGVITPSDTGVTQTLIEPSVEPIYAPDGETTFDDLPQYMETRAVHGAVRNARQELEDAIYEAFGWDKERTPKSAQGNINAAVRDLYPVGYRACDIPVIYAYCAKRFNDDKGFTPAALPKHAQAAMKEASSANGHNPLAGRTEITG